ncbi:MAG: glutamate--cysteine ligase, partial [Actinobacteria bacterium]|nr:glutamate--cysteine ligase [Actinomycetota bacterium]
AAFYYGLVHMLAEAERPIWSQMSFAAAHDNLMEGARHGLEARLYWPGLGEVPAAELTLRRLLGLAYEGLCRRGVDTREAERLLGVIEQRCLAGRTGAAWQTETVHALEERSGLDRDTALREMTQRYLKLMNTGEPVHTWPVC